ncbi:hypothetical protein BGZ94_002147 [Podila epigama]|nr:hypothetical protein BGZ94_002147 [Podila epigama]
MGNAPSNQGEQNDTGTPVEAVTFTNQYQNRQNRSTAHHNHNHHQQHSSERQHQDSSYMTHQHHASSPHDFPLHSSPPKDSIHPSTIPIASHPVDTTTSRRFPVVRDTILANSPAGSSPVEITSAYDRRDHQNSTKQALPGGGPRRRASSLVSSQPYGQYTDAFNEQALIASAAHQDKLEHQRPQQLAGDGRASYRNSARVSRTFDTLDPLKGLDGSNDDSKDGYVPTIITWSQGGTNVYVTGTFNNWKQKVRLNKSTSDFSTILNLPPGTHRIKFIVDDEWKCSSELSAATDAEGNLVNFLEVADEEQDELEGGQYTPINDSPVGSYTDQIPAYARSGTSTPQPGASGSEALQPLTSISTPGAEGNNNNNNNHSSAPGGRDSPSSVTSSSSSKMFESTSSISNEPPPALPPHLEKVILNNVPSKEDNSVLPVPNHVVLNHLYACSVKEGVLSISVTSRYRKKYITTVFIKPVVTN